MERGVWGERLKKSFHFKYKFLIFLFWQLKIDNIYSLKAIFFIKKLRFLILNS
jgi:hypothetical protein